MAGEAGAIGGFKYLENLSMLHLGPWGTDGCVV